MFLTDAESGELLGHAADLAIARGRPDFFDALTGRWCKDLATIEALAQVLARFVACASNVEIADCETDLAVRIVRVRFTTIGRPVGALHLRFNDAMRVVDVTVLNRD
jgi:hypothetical protein